MGCQLHRELRKKYKQQVVPSFKTFRIILRNADMVLCMRICKILVILLKRVNNFFAAYGQKLIKLKTCFFLKVMQIA